jgi:hypothetical protein
MADDRLGMIFACCHPALAPEVFGVAIVAAVFAGAGQLGGAQSVTAGFRPALAVSALLSALGAVSALAMTTRNASMSVTYQEVAATARS